MEAAVSRDVDAWAGSLYVDVCPVDTGAVLAAVGLGEQAVELTCGEVGGGYGARTVGGGKVFTTNSNSDSDTTAAAAAGPLVSTWVMNRVGWATSQWLLRSSPSDAAATPSGSALSVETAAIATTPARGQQQQQGLPLPGSSSRYTGINNTSSPPPSAASGPTSGLFTVSDVAYNTPPTLIFTIEQPSPPTAASLTPASLEGGAPSATPLPVADLLLSQHLQPQQQQQLSTAAAPSPASSLARRRFIHAAEAAKTAAYWRARASLASSRASTRALLLEATPSPSPTPSPTTAAGFSIVTADGSGVSSTSSLSGVLSRRRTAGGAASGGPNNGSGWVGIDGGGGGGSASGGGVLSTRLGRSTPPATSSPSPPATSSPSPPATSSPSPPAAASGDSVASAVAAGSLFSAEALRARGYRTSAASSLDHYSYTLARERGAGEALTPAASPAAAAAAAAAAALGKGEGDGRATGGIASYTTGAASLPASSGALHLEEYRYELAWRRGPVVDVNDITATTPTMAIASSATATATASPPLSIRLAYTWRAAVAELWPHASRAGVSPWSQSTFDVYHAAVAASTVYSQSVSFSPTSSLTLSTRVRACCAGVSAAATHCTRGFASYELVTQLLLLASALYLRVFLHGMGQFLYLAALRVPISAFYATPVSTVARYPIATLPVEVDVGVVAAGPLFSLLCFAVVAAGSSGASRLLNIHTTEVISRFIAALGVAAVLDPPLIAIVDAALGRFSCAAAYPAMCGASSGTFAGTLTTGVAVGAASLQCACTTPDALVLPAAFAVREGCIVVGVLLTLLIYSVIMLLAVGGLAYYLMRVHRGGRVADAFRRVSTPAAELGGRGSGMAAASAAFPSDTEISGNELAWLVSKSLLWRGRPPPQQGQQTTSQQLTTPGGRAGGGAPSDTPLNKAGNASSSSSGSAYGGGGRGSLVYAIRRRLAMWEVAAPPRMAYGRQQAPVASLYPLCNSGSSGGGGSGRGRRGSHSLTRPVASQQAASDTPSTPPEPHIPSSSDRDSGGVRRGRVRVGGAGGGGNEEGLEEGVAVGVGPATPIASSASLPTPPNPHLNPSSRRGSWGRGQYQGGLSSTSLLHFADVDAAPLSSSNAVWGSWGHWWGRWWEGNKGGAGRNLRVLLYTEYSDGSTAPFRCFLRRADGAIVEEELPGVRVPEVGALGVLGAATTAAASPSLAAWAGMR